LPVGAEVTLSGGKTDLYGRTVSEILNKDKQNVNKKMVELGLAVHYMFQRGCEEYGQIEKSAKKAKLGVKLKQIY
jgi:endonuclease YncB( thermonuclease family)